MVLIVIEMIHRRSHFYHPKKYSITVHSLWHGRQKKIDAWRIAHTFTYTTTA